MIAGICGSKAPTLFLSQGAFFFHLCFELPRYTKKSALLLNLEDTLRAGYLESSATNTTGALRLVRNNVFTTGMCCTPQEAHCSGALSGTIKQDVFRTAPSLDARDGSKPLGLKGHKKRNAIFGSFWCPQAASHRPECVVLWFTSRVCVAACGDRLNVRDIVILASDGASTLETELVQSEARMLIDRGIRTFAIGQFLNPIIGALSGFIVHS